MDYEIIFNSTASNLTIALLNTELEKALNNSNGTIGNGSFVLGPIEGIRLFIVEDKDECISDKPCDENAVCNNTVGSFLCGCKSGFSGDGFICTDMNECFTAPCDRNGFCTNTPGSFNCTCNAALTGDGFSCGGVNCSVLSCQRNESCVKRGELYYCSSTEDDSDVLSDVEFALVVVLPIIAFVLLLIIVLVIYKKRVDKQGKEKYTADVRRQGIRSEDRHIENYSNQQDTQM